MMEQRPVQRYRFGVFEADAATGELRRQGIRIKLNAQPFQVLFMLLERPGELLTREEISRQLWPDGTFVDYEQGVNSVVNRIREALGDSASQPRFVETLARRGYRFVAPVERVPAAGGESVGPAKSLQYQAVEPVAQPRLRLLATAEDLPRAPRRVVCGLFLGLQLMYLGFYVGALANLGEIGELFSVLPEPAVWMNVLIASAALLIPVRAFVVCGVLFRAPGMAAKFMKLWRFLLPLDVLWALSPFLLLHHVDFGLAVAGMALLVYSPFAQRSLVLMGAAEG